MDAGAGQPPRSAAATRAGEAALVDRRRGAQPSGWWGMALFLCAEVTLFGSLMATYFYLDFIAHRWPPAGIKPPSVVLPLICTAVLLTTSIPMILAVRAARSGRRGRVIRLLLFAALIQSAYLAAQILLFRHDLRQFTPQSSAYGSIYFTLLAAHHAHVLLGILLDLAVAFQVFRQGLTNYWLIGTRCVALYWHVVNAVAILVVLTQLSPSL
jgi:heme/copper-type cytochrome/quinol oxidase subunit 3